MSKAEAARLRHLEDRVVELERIVGQMDARLVDDEIGADHEAQKAAFPRKTLTLKGKAA